MENILVIVGLSEKYPAILNITKTVCVALL